MVPPRVSRPIGAPAKISRHCCRMDSPSLGVTFFLGIARNPLKSPESDKRIQENPSSFSWFGLVRLWFGLEGFGRGATRDHVRRAPLRERAALDQPARKRYCSTIPYNFRMAVNTAAAPGRAVDDRALL